MLKHLTKKFKESFLSVLPIIIIVLALNFTIAPLPFYTLVLFLISAFVLVLGVTFFTLGVDMSMISIGEKIGSSIVKTRKLPLIIFLTFIIGVFITIAEPDLKILAAQITSIPDNILIISIGVGVGLSLVLAFIRVFFQIKFSYILIALYSTIFILTAFINPEFVSIAFEAGGVTTGPILVPFIMAIGLGLVSVQSSKSSQDNTFGLVSLCLIGPIIAVLILSKFFTPSSESFIIPAIKVDSLSDIFSQYFSSLPIYISDVFVALLPVILLFVVFQIITIKLKRKPLLKIFVGTIYTFIGLVLFLTSVNLGFMSVGSTLGKLIVEQRLVWLLIPLGMVFGYFIVTAEPAVFVLKQQVQDITDGAISAKSMGISLSIGVSISVGLAMLRVITGLQILWFIIPGYSVALILSFFVPSFFTSIAFDSGAVASGPLAATFLLPFAMGASAALGGNVFADAFGIVSMVAMTPVITIQFMGLIYKIKGRNAAKKADEYIIDDIIEYDIDDEIV